tara:strand:+ start:214 stop:447 length:234 start_codon:yes stop_codon:yes gene_type:complete
MVQYNDGIPFSYLRKQLMKKHKRTKKKAASPNRKKRKEKKRTKKRPIKIPKGVIIRKKGKLYRSTGKKLEQMTHNRV